MGSVVLSDTHKRAPPHFLIKFALGRKSKLIQKTNYWGGLFFRGTKNHENASIHGRNEHIECKNAKTLGKISKKLGFHYFSSKIVKIAIFTAQSHVFSILFWPPKSHFRYTKKNFGRRNLILGTLKNFLTGPVKIVIN